MEVTENKDLFQIIFDSAANGIGAMQPVYDDTGKVANFSILLFNKYLLKWIGDADYKGKLYTDVFPMAKENDILGKFIAVAETGITTNFERLYVIEDISYWFRFTAVKQSELLVVTIEDITQQKQAEEIIQQKDERFRFALKAGHLGSWELDLTTFAFNASDYCKKNFGQPEDKPFLYQTLVDSIHPDDRKRQQDEVASTISTGKDYDIEYRVIWPDGTLHWVNIRGQLYTNKDGKPGYMVGVSVDITNRKETEIALIKSLEASEKQERLYDSITNNTPDLVYVFGLDYRFTYANKALLAMWGKSAEDAIGLGLRENGYEEWHAQLHEREIDEVAATKKSIRGTVSFPHAELGSRVYDYILVPVLNEKGEVEVVAGTTRDITELKYAEKKLQESEARFRNLLQEAPVAATLFRGPDLVIEIANELTQQYWRKGKDIIGKPVAEAAPELEDQQMIALLKDMYQRGGMANFSETPITFVKNGTSKEGYYSFSIKALYDSAGNVDGILSVGNDVTEQVKARKQLEESGARLKSMIDQTPAPTLVLMGADLVIEQINPSMLQMIGRGQEIIGIPLIKIMPELQGQYVWEQVQKVYREGTPFDQSEVLVPHKRTGEIEDYYYNIAYRPLKEEGRITGMIQVAIDVTEQVMARKKLEESESRFRALVNASSDVIYSLNADWTVMQPLDGRGFLLDTHAAIEGWMEINVHPLDLDIVKKTIAKSIANKTVFELEHRVIRADRTMGWTFSRAIPILDDHNNIIEWFGSAGDITAQKEMQEIIKQSEEKFRQIADLIPQIIWTGNADGFIDYYNKRWYEYTGFDGREFGDQSWVPILHPDDVTLVMEHWYNSVQKGTSYQLEFRLKHAETGEYRWFLSKAVPIKDKEEMITKWFGTCTDIHEQKTITEKLESLVAERTKELKRSNEDLQQFAHVASHDLKEPIRKIKTFTSRLEDQLGSKLDESAIRFIEKIHVSTDRIYTMIDGVLAYSTMNANKQNPELVDLNNVLQHIETDLEIALQKSGGTIQYSNLPALEGAPVLLYQLFYNLVNNSIKFSKAGVPLQIHISSEASVESGISSARITVEDNGIGFEADMSERIFETFTRLNSKDKYEGTGLGLSLCKKIVERHSGNITAIGSRDNGATFIITLPLHQKGTGI